jgi:hypothetical protein
MNVLAKLLAETGASLIGARPMPADGKQAEHGAFRALLERAGLSKPSDADGTPTAPAVAADGKEPDAPPEANANEHPRSATGKGMTRFQLSLGRFDHDEPNGENQEQADANLAETVSAPAVATVLGLHSPLGDDAPQADRDKAANARLNGQKPAGPTAREHSARPEAKVLNGLSADDRLPSAPRHPRPSNQASRVLPTFSGVPANATREVQPVVATVVREETHLPPAKPITLPLKVGAPPTEHADRQSSRQEDHPEPKTDRHVEKVRGARGGGPDATASSSARTPAAQHHAANAATTAGATGEGGGAGGGLPAGALQTVASAIGDAAGPAPAKGVTPLTPPVEAATPGPVRDVALKLEVPDHGALNVRMSLNGRALTIRLSAERDETAHRLRHDRDALSHLLRQAGYDANIVAIEGRRSAVAQPQHPATQAQPMVSGSQAGNSGLPSGGNHQTSYASDQQPRHDHFQPAHPDQPFHETNQQPSDSDRRGLYV